MYKSCSFDKKDDNDDDDDADFDEEDFFWRKLLHDSLFKFMPVAPFRYRCRDMDKWSIWYRFRLGMVGVIPHKDVERNLMMGAIHLDLVSRTIFRGH
jgi:hypothetical protein